MMTLTDIIEGEFRRARREFTKLAADEIFTPKFCGYNDHGMMFAMASPFDSPDPGGVLAKDISTMMCRQLLRQHGCVAYSVSAEAWFVRRPVSNGDAAAALAKFHNEATPPSEQPDRQECLIIYAEVSGGQNHAGMWMLRRGENGRVHGFDRCKEDGDRYESLRFGGLLRASSS